MARFRDFLIVVFISPLYFALRKQWGNFLINSIFYILAVFTVFVFGIGIAFWLVGVLHAMWYLRRELTQEAAETLATKMVEKLKATNQNAGTTT